MVHYIVNSFPILGLSPFKGINSLLTMLSLGGFQIVSLICVLKAELHLNHSVRNLMVTAEQWGGLTMAGCQVLTLPPQLNMIRCV